MSYKSSVSSEEILLLPVGNFPGEIVVVDTPGEIVRMCSVLSRSRVIGFDTETRPSFAKGKTNSMSLMQLSVENSAYLVRINRTQGARELAEILEDTSIIKVGASIRDDIKGVRKWMHFEPGGFMDIQHIVQGYGINDISLRKVSAIVLGLRISKAQRLSNWDADTLTPAQQLYAATDAWACREIFLKLKSHRPPQEIIAPMEEKQQ